MAVNAPASVRTPVRSRDWWCVVLSLAIPLVVSAVVALTDHYRTFADNAIIEVQVRSVGSAVTPMVGAWSRFGWSHPGPLPFYLLAVPYRLFGGAAAGLQIGVLVLNGAALFGLLAILRRHGRTALLLGAAGALLLVLGLGAPSLRNEWNATTPVLPFVLLLVAAWDAADGTRLPLVLAPLAATFVMQAHAGYLALSVPALAWWAYAVWHRRHDRAAMRAVVLVSLVTALAWSPVIADAAAHGGGNLRTIASWSLRSHAGLGFAGAAHLMGDASSVSLPLFAVPTVVEPFQTLDPTRYGWGPGAVVMLLAIGWLLAVRLRTAETVRRLAALLLVTWVVGFVATAGIAGPLYAHLLWWSWGLAMLSWLCGVLLALRICAAIWPGGVVRSGRLGIGAVACGVVVACVVLTVRVIDTPFQVTDPVQRTDELSRLVRHAVGRTTVLIDYRDSYLDRGFIVAGVMAQLARDGVRVVIPRDIGRPQFPDDRLVVRNRFRGARLLVTGPEAVMLPPGTFVGAADPLNSRERQRWQRDYLRVQAALIAAHRPELVGWLPGPFIAIARQRAHGALRGVEREMANLERLNARGPAQLLWRV